VRECLDVRHDFVSSDGPNIAEALVQRVFLQNINSTASKTNSNYSGIDSRILSYPLRDPKDAFCRNLLIL